MNFVILHGNSTLLIKTKLTLRMGQMSDVTFGTGRKIRIITPLQAVTYLRPTYVSGLEMYRYKQHFASDLHRWSGRVCAGGWVERRRV